MLCAVLGRNQFAILRIGASFDSKMNGGKTVKRISARELAVMAICLTLGLLAKRIISPLTNTLTDFFRIPGGSATVGFSLAFLVVGKHMSHVPCAATMMGFVQSLLALALGMSGYPGMLAVFSYTFPGIVIDVIFNSENGPCQISFNDDGNVIFVNFEQLSKQSFPILVTPSGIIIDVIFVL